MFTSFPTRRFAAVAATVVLGVGGGVRVLGRG